MAEYGRGDPASVAAGVGWAHPQSPEEGIVWLKAGAEAWDRDPPLERGGRRAAGRARQPARRQADGGPAWGFGLLP